MTREFQAMRTCPQCGRTFHDEYNFCLVDGTLLSFAEDVKKTEILHNVHRVVPDSVPTVDPRNLKEPAPTVKVHTPTTTEPPLPTIASFKPNPVSNTPVETQRNVPLLLFKITLGVFGLVIILAVIGGSVVGLVEWQRERNVAATTNTSPTPTATPTPKPTATVTSTPTPTPDPTPTKPIVIPNPTLDPKNLPQSDFPNMEGRYYLREYQGDDTALTALDLYDENGPDFYLHETADNIYGTVHLDHTEKNEWVGYVVWEYSNGTKDREIIYVCENWKGLCGKLPGASWYFVATKRSGD